MEINEQLRQELFAIAYKMTGQVSLSQDICQDVFQKILDSKVDFSQVKHHRAYVIKMAVNRSLDVLKQLQKERYAGVWLPEPVCDNDNDYSALDLDYGITVLLSRLNPKERAVFLLKESFDYSYAELAETLELTAVNCRKIYQRLQPKLKKNSQTIIAERGTKERVLKAFLSAVRNGQLDGLVAMLKEDIALYSDGGGKVAAARNVLYGIEACFKFMWGIYSKFLQNARFEFGSVNQEPCVFIYEAEQLATIVLIQLEDHQISELYFIRNPDKLEGLN